MDIAREVGRKQDACGRRSASVYMFEDGVALDLVRREDMVDLRI